MNIEKQYLKLLKDIMKNGVKKDSRTGTGTISVFGRQIRHDMSEGFPLLTTKRMYWKGIVTELLWFLRGDTNIKYLVDNDCHIWDGDAYKNYYYKEIPHDHMLDKEDFIKRIKTDDEFAKKWGDLGPIYGKQWRNWNSYESNTKVDGVYDIAVIDQISNLIEQLKTNPDSRRLMVNAWNVGDLDQMVLPPCHYGFQVYTSVRNDKRYISLMWNQRSVDTPLGLPFNIASYALLLRIIAKEVDMIPDELIGNLGDCHIYSNQIDGVYEQLNREIGTCPELVFTDPFWAICEEDIPFADKVNRYDLSWFTIEDYMPQPAIKFPLSN
jgi:thymidylate synthase